MRSILVERGGVYGDFERDNAAPVMAMREAMGIRHTEGLPPMLDSTIVGHEYIRLKLARLRVTPEHEDTHLDLACYAVIVLACIRRASGTDKQEDTKRD